MTGISLAKGSWSTIGYQQEPSCDVAASKKFGAFTTKDTEVTEARERDLEIVSQISFLCLFLRVLCALCGASFESFRKPRKFADADAKAAKKRIQTRRVSRLLSGAGH